MLESGIRRDAARPKGAAAVRVLTRTRTAAAHRRGRRDHAVAAEGDIGRHFPPSDPQWKGASSDRFLRHAVELIASRAGRVDHLDCTVICEAPKIGPHRSAIQARVAEIAGLRPDQVSVKATTTERLGFTGRGEGIAAQAVATIRLPDEA